MNYIGLVLMDAGHYVPGGGHKGLYIFNRFAGDDTSSLFLSLASDHHQRILAFIAHHHAAPARARGADDG